MSDLDTNLQAIADSKEHSYNCAAHGEGQECCIEKPEIIAQIKRAFGDAGYYNGSNIEQKDNSGMQLMTGQEWYSKFKNIIDQEMSNYAEQTRTLLLERAKRAAGIEC